MNNQSQPRDFDQGQDTHPVVVRRDVLHDLDVVLSVACSSAKLNSLLDSVATAISFSRASEAWWIKFNIRSNFSLVGVSAALA